MLATGASAAEISSALHLRRDQYYAAVSALTASGMLSEVGDLPPGATTELCPPQEATDLFTVMADVVEWSQESVTKIKSLMARYGWSVPTSPDERYTRSRWTGQAVRRVDFSHDRYCYMVVGFLIPRADKAPWQRATPKFRTVYVERDGQLLHSWVAERNTIVNLHGVFDDHPSGKELSELAKAVAWVCESRAVLAEVVIEGSHPA